MPTNFNSGNIVVVFCIIHSLHQINRVVFILTHDYILCNYHIYHRYGKSLILFAQCGESVMKQEQAKRPDPLKTIQKLIAERYSEAQAIFWAGSVSQNQGTEASDLDLVIVFDSIPNAYREAFIYRSEE